MKYSRDQLPCGAILNFMPLVYEHFGSWGAKASEYLQQIFKKTNIYGTWNRSQFLFYWRARFGIILQQCNAQVILKKVKRSISSNHGNDSESDD